MQTILNFMLPLMITVKVHASNKILIILLISPTNGKYLCIHKGNLGMKEEHGSIGIPGSMGLTGPKEPQGQKASRRIKKTEMEELYV